MSNVVFICVTSLDSRSACACGADNKEAGLSEGFSFPDVLLHAKGDLIDNHDGTATLNYMTRLGCFCFCETEHINVSDRMSWM